MSSEELRTSPPLVIGSPGQGHSWTSKSVLQDNHRAWSVVLVVRVTGVFLDTAAEESEFLN